MKDQGPVPALEPTPRVAPLSNGVDVGVLNVEHRPSTPTLDVDLLLAQESWVRAVARHLVRDPARAEDVAQETMLAALQSPPRDAEDPRRLRAWLGRVAHNLAHLDTRRRMRRRAREERVAQGEAQCSVAEVVVHGSILTEVEAAVAELEEPYQSAVRARYFEGKSTQEIARATSTTDNAIRKRLWRAREKLRLNLDRRHNGERLAWFNALAPVVGLSPAGTGTGTGTELATGAGAKTVGAGWKLAAALPLVVGGAALAVLMSGGGHEVALGEDSVTLARSGERVPVALPPEQGTSSTSSAVEQVSTLLDAGSDESAGSRTESAETQADAQQEEAPGEQGVQPPAIVGRVLHARDGLPVAGLEIGQASILPASLAGDATVSELERSLDSQHEADEAREPVSGKTDAQGRFSIESRAGIEASSLVVLQQGFATIERRVLPGSSTDPEQDPSLDELLFLVAESVDVSGVVVDADGMPVAGARILLVLEERYLIDLELAVDNLESLTLSTLTEADGSFRLAGVPSGDGALLRVMPFDGQLLDRLEPVRLLSRDVAVPSFDDSSMLIELEAPPAPKMIVAGTVLLENRGPAQAATVRFGNYSTRTDSQGQFELEIDDVDPRADLRAHQEGWVEAALDNFGERVAQGDLVDMRDGVTLTLYERARRISGSFQGIGAGWHLGSTGDAQLGLVDERDSQGHPRGNHGPSYDGDHAGSDEGGGGVGHDGGGDFNESGEGENFGAPPPPPDEDRGDRPGPEDPPSGRTGDDGGFDLPGFDPRDGRRWIQGVDPRTGRVFRAGPVQPGGGPVDLPVQPVEPRTRLDGRLVDLDGDPFDDARVRVSVLLGVQPGPQGLTTERWEDGVIVLTDDDGRFVLEGVPALFADLRIEHPELGTILVRLPDHAGGPGDVTSADDPVTIALPRLHAFRVRAEALPGAVTFRLEDGEAQQLLLIGADDDRWSGTLYDGRSVVLRAPESARTLVLFDAADQVLVRIPIRLVGGDTPTVLTP